MDLWGTWEKMYKWLLEKDITSINWKGVHHQANDSLFTPSAKAKDDLYPWFYKVTGIFPGAGIVTARDRLTIRDTAREMYD